MSEKNNIEPIYFWVDFLEFTINNFKNLNFSKKYDFTFHLDFDNSSQWFINTDYWYFSYRKVNFKNYNWWLIFTISIDWVAFDIFYFALWAVNKAKIKTKSKIWFYSTFFVLENIWKLPFSIVEFYKSNFLNENNSLHRLDICLDLSWKIEDINNTIFKWVNFYSSLWKDKKNDMFAQTYYIKNPLSSKNRFYLFRIYDKILDTFKKWKNFLFSYLEDYEDVRRIELELRQDSCSMIFEKIEKILENKNFICERIFKQYFEKEWNCNIKELKKFWWFNDIVKISLLTKTKSRIDLGDVYWYLGHIPKNYISMAHWYIKKIYDVAGVDWVIELLFKVHTEKENKSYVKIIQKPDFCYLFFGKLLSFFEKQNLNKYVIQSIYNEKYKNKIVKIKKS